MLYSAVVATNLPGADGKRLSDNALAEMAAMTPSLPITINFSIYGVGRALSANVQDGKLSVVIETPIMQRRLSHKDKPALYLVPVGQIQEHSLDDDGLLIINHLELMCYSVVMLPAEEIGALTPLQEVINGSQS